MNRRQFLSIVGGGVVIAAGGVGGCTVVDSVPDAALKPWQSAGSLYTEPRRNALSYAILAPNPHNRQPWLVDLSEPDHVMLYADRDRLLPHTDPFSRQITIGLGCFLELMTMAAAADGYRVMIEPFPEGADPERLDGRPVARARFSRDSAIPTEPLFAYALARRSLKEPYDLARPVPQQSLAELHAAVIHGSAVGSSQAPETVDTLRRLTREALLVEIETPRTYKESVDLFRIGKAEIEANPDGIDFSGPTFELMRMVGLFSRESALDPSSMAYGEGIAAVLENAETAMAHLWLVSRGNARIEQLNAGRDWLRVNLAATAAGLATQPLSQALQEYPEVQPFRDEIHGILAPDGGTVQMLARLGFADPVAPSPRWPLDTRLIANTT